MAEEVTIADTGSTAKVRNIIALPFLILVTLGIYYFVWWYKINREMADLGRAHDTDELGDSPGTSLLAVTLGALVIVPALISLYRGFHRVQAAMRLSGLEPLNGWIALVLYLLLGFIYPSYVQSGLNQVWENQPAAGTDVTPPPAPAAA